MRATASLVTRNAMIAVALLALGCGGTQLPDCSQFTACGGTVLGSWTFTGDCGLFNTHCDVTAADYSSWTNRVTFNGDDTWVVKGGGTASYSLSKACLGITSDGECARYDDSSYHHLQCRGAGLDCACALEDANGFTSSGTFKLDGYRITMTRGGRPDKTFDYCVNGDELRLAVPSDARQFEVYRR